MPEQEQESERVAGGPLGKVVGKAKEAVGSALGNEALSREGRAQQVQAETEQEAAELAEEAGTKQEQAEITEERAENQARRRRLEHELGTARQEESIERREASTLAAADEHAEDEKLAAERGRQSQELAADAAEGAAGRRETEELKEADRLRRQAEQAERRAEAVDPEGDA